jgi:hypothetical protein
MTMRQDLSDITVVLDRSRSMESCKSKAEEGLNAFIGEQKKLSGDAVFSLVQFDTEYEFVHQGIPIKSVPHCKLEPRGSTALNDAVARAIQETGKRLGDMPESDRPGLVILVILTDGEENSSIEFAGTEGRKRIKEMIKHQQEKYGWQFTFLGANQDAFLAADSYGIARAATANYDAEEKTAAAFGAASANVGRMRLQSAGGQAVRSAYTDEERERMK